MIVVCVSLKTISAPISLAESLPNIFLLASCKRCLLEYAVKTPFHTEFGEIMHALAEPITLAPSLISTRGRSFCEISVVCGQVLYCT